VSLSGEAAPGGPFRTARRGPCSHLFPAGEPTRGAAARTAGARLRRVAAALAAVTCALLGSAAVVPAAVATMLPDGDPPYGPGPAAPVPATAIRVVTAGGVAGWQIALIAAGAALVAAAAAVLIDRARTTRRGLSATTA